ncbi:hypothetical protein F5877DRAFT_73304 [Lentinula edodes]|nr:hypothetical protein F5877DRAFT_73304 [Lentinula edodes]
MPNWEHTHMVHHSRTNFPVQPLLEMTLRLEDFIRIQECTPEDIASVLQEVLELMVQFLTVGTQLEIDLPGKAQQWLMTLTDQSDFLWLYNFLLDPKRMLELLEVEACYGQSSRNPRGILPSILRPTEEKGRSALRPGYIYCTEQ